MISVINMTILTIVFIAQLVERRDNFLLFRKAGNWYKIKKKKGKYFEKGSVKSQPGSPETSFSLKFPPGLSPFGSLQNSSSAQAQHQVPRYYLSWKGLQGSGKHYRNHTLHTYTDVVGVGDNHSLDLRSVIKCKHSDHYTNASSENNNMNLNVSTRKYNIIIFRIISVKFITDMLEILQPMNSIIIIRYFQLSVFCNVIDRMGDQCWFKSQRKK